MKIQKAIFSCSEPPAYSSYWNMQSRLCREGLGIEPVCLLYGKKTNTDMRENYGKIIEMETVPDLPWALQMTFSKFQFACSEPETVWITGDMDLLPLSKPHFTSNIEHVPDDHYLCLNHDGISISRTGRPNSFLERGSERHGKDGGFVGCDIPAHYHVAKGKLFNQLYFQDKTLLEAVKMIVDSNRFGMGVMCGWPVEKKTTDPYWWYWCSEENFTSFTLWNAIKAGQISYKGFSYHNSLQRLYAWNKDKNDYIYNPEAVKHGDIVDIHCSLVRPYAPQAEALERIIRLSGLISI